MERLRKLAERWPWLKVALDVQARVGETNGGAIASAATVMFFVALFPLILVSIAVVGFLASGDSTVAADIVDALGLTGRAADQVITAIGHAEDSRRAASVIGFLGLLWSGLGVTSAVALAVRTPWQRKSEGLRSRLVGLAWLVGGALTFAGAIGAGALLNRTPEAVPRALTSVVLLAIGLALELAFFLWTFWALGDRRTGWRALLPGAVLGAVGFEVLKLAATVVVPRMVASSSSLYGPLGVIFALLAWLTLFSRLIVYASALNAVRWEGEHGVATLEIKAPFFEGEDAVEADRGGAVTSPSDEPEVAGDRP